MDPTEGTLAASPAAPAAAASRCPDCGASWGALPPQTTQLLDGAAVRRCAACGTRATTEPEAVRSLLECVECGLPFLLRAALPGAPRLCASCSSCAPFEVESLDQAVVEATEGEVRAALARSFRFVGSPGVSAYLERVARETAEAIEGSPRDSRVVLLDDDSVLSLALPAGTLLVSRGALSRLRDEAELAFVLGHELSHAAAGDPAGWLVRVGFQGMAGGRREAVRDVWTRAVRDLLVLGYGASRELRADARALAAVKALGYDLGSVRRYLERVGDAAAGGDPAVAALALAHPAVRERLRPVDEAIRRQLAAPTEKRTNREVFRRAAGATVVVRELNPSDAFGNAAETPPRIGRAARLGFTVLGILLLAAAFLAVGLWLAG